MKKRNILARTVKRPGEKLGQYEKLSEVIAGEIVPRLMLLHTPERPGACPKAAARGVDLATQVADFADLAVRHEHEVLEAYVKSLLHRGLDLETLLLHLLAPAARRLGMLWEADTIDFVDVTIGASRLQHLVHRLTSPLPRHDGCDRHALFLPVPGEQHTFGLVMVSEFFRREGWQVNNGGEMTADALYSLISEHYFMLIGFSVSCDRLIAPLCSTIQAVRRLSKNQSVLIMAGGRIFAQDPRLRPRVGADIVASDACEALELVEGALRLSASRRGEHHP